MLAGMFSLPEVRHAALALLAFAAAVPADLLGAPWPLVAVLYGACYVAGGWEPAWSGVQALREKTLDVDILMIVAALGAAAIGQWLDGALLIVIFAGSGALEAVMTARTRASITGLLDLAPETAHRLDGSPVPVASLQVGDLLLVRPGEKLPADGVVVEGASEIDASSLTGEPLPVTRRAGDPVFAGTLNGTGALRVRVTVDPAETVVAGIAAQVERAAETKSKCQLWVERVEQRYSVIVVLAAIAVFVVPLLLGEDLRSALLRAMTFMIVASPCAIVLATMPPLLAAIAVAGRRGVLLKEAGVVEALAEVDAVVLDKTGTVTSGRPQVRSVEPLAGWSADEVLALAAGAEQGSEHVLARAVLGEARRRSLEIPGARETTAIPGEGVTALVERRGRPVRVTVGRPSSDARESGAARHADRCVGAPDSGSGMRESTKRAVPALEGEEGAGRHADGCVGAPDSGSGMRESTKRAVGRAESTGHTAVVVWVEREPVGVLVIADEPRAGARAAIAALSGTVAAPTLLTGDAEGPARAVAARTGITAVRAGLTPADKSAHLPAKALAVGDGLNDAPLLAGAHVGLAVGDGAATLSVEAADGVLMRDPLGSLAPLVVLARRARRIARANLAFAAAVIVALVTWDLVGTLPLALGVAGHELSTVLVCLNGLRILVWPGWSGGEQRRERHAAEDVRDLVGSRA
jgi:cation-transporting P-type ATPase J